MIVVAKIRIQSRPITTRMEAALTNRLNAGGFLFFLCARRLVVGAVDGVGLRKLSNAGEGRDMYSEDIDVPLCAGGPSCNRNGLWKRTGLRSRECKDALAAPC